MIQSLRVAALPILAITLFAVGESLPDSSNVLKFITEIGAFGLLWYIVCRTMPRKDENHKIEQKATRALWRSEAEAERTHYREVIDNMLERQEKDRADTRELVQQLIRESARQQSGGQPG